MNFNYQGKPYSIRQAEKTDYELIKDLLQSVDLPIEGVRENINDFLTLLDEKQLIGTVGLEVYEDKALLRSLAIAKEQQGKGYGRKLCQSIIERAQKHKVSELYLLTEGAEGFFASQGFKTISREMVDEKVKSSVEFRKVCPESATCMFLKMG